MPLLVLEVCASFLEKQASVHAARPTSLHFMPPSTRATLPSLEGYIKTRHALTLRTNPNSNVCFQLMAEHFFDSHRSITLIKSGFKTEAKVEIRPDTWTTSRSYEVGALEVTWASAEACYLKSWLHLSCTR